MTRLTTENYFDQVKKVDWKKAPSALVGTHNLIKKVGTGTDAWVNYRESEQIRKTIDKAFELTEKYLAAHPELQVNAASAPKPAAAPKASKAPAAKKTSARRPKFAEGQRVHHKGKVAEVTRAPFADSSEYEYSIRYDGERIMRAGVKEAELTPAPKAPKPAATPKVAKPAVAPKAPKASKSASAVLPEIEYFNGKGKLVKGRVDAEKLYYVQPDGSYEQGGNRRSPGRVKPPKAKAVRAKKAKPVDVRREVPQLSPEVLIMQAFLKLENKPATIDQVRALHRRIEKDFMKQKVRKVSRHADLLRGIAGTVAALYTRMTEKGIGSIAKLEFKTEDAKQLVNKARHEVEGVRVGTATTLLSAFVNLQGTVPTEKTVLNLRTKLENEFVEYPDGDFALAVGAAAAVLKDWKPGKPVRVTKQQLSGLAGLMDLGCPDTPPGKACGCSSSAAPKKARR